MALVAYGLITGVRKHKVRRRAFFEEFAKKHKLDFIEYDEYGIREKLDAFHYIGFAKKEIENIVFCKEDNAGVYLFDQLKYTLGTSGTKGGFFTICLVDREKPCGAYVVIYEVQSRLVAGLSRKLSKRMSGMSSLKFDDIEFDDRFVVFSDNPDKIWKLVGPEVRQYLLGYAGKLPMPFVLRIKDNMITVYNTESSVRTIREHGDLETILELGKGLNERL